MSKPLNVLKLGFLPFINEYFAADRIEHHTKTEQLAASKLNQNEANQESGWNRIKRMFEIDEFGNVTPEVNSILQSGCMSMFVGGLIGGSVEGKRMYEQFIAKNEATTFKSHFEAKKELQEAVSRAFSRGAIKWSVKLTGFSVIFLGLSTLIQVYRGKYGLLEYLGAGATTGFVYKFNGGPRGWVVGSGLGSALGLFCGCTTLGLLKLSGISMEEARYWQYKWKENRSEYMRKGMAEHLEKEDFAIIKIHNDEVGTAGTSLDNLDKEHIDKKENDSK